jgi:aspartyl-tRNA(Asn)/glutamyl-tRNA(Gln) amidotransferase subunit C
MDMDREEIHRIAGLARIELTDEEATLFAHEVATILKYVSEVQSITGDVPPEKVPGALVNVMRKDINPNEPGLYREDLLNAAPKRTGDYIEVKKILQN